MFQPMRRPAPNWYRMPLLLVLLLLMIGIVAPPAAGQEPMNLAQFSMDKRLVISAGAFFVRFNSSYKYDDQTSNERVFVHLEGQLDLPTTEIVANFIAQLRIAERHYLVGEYVSLRRSSERRLLQGSLDTGRDTVAIDAQTTATMNYNFVDIGYAYMFFRDERTLVLGKLGVHIFDLNAAFSINGDLVVNQDPYSGEISDGTDFVAFFPLVGAILNFQIARRWFVQNLVDFVYLPIGDSQAAAIRTVVAGRFMFNRTVGIQAGVSYNFERVKYTEDGVTQEVEFDFSGLGAGLYLAF
ncbi:MAG: hypothetical protein JSW50_07850 [Candidatus Latescibacterota bacterium]|nr:MAG: hypothetical protein JSW50_07850 [Candidatus Latescibacterota bacterium]